MLNQTIPCLDFSGKDTLATPNLPYVVSHKRYVSHRLIVHSNLFSHTIQSNEVIELLVLLVLRRAVQGQYT